MKKTKLNVILQAIACGTIALNFTPQLHGQEFNNQFENPFSGSFEEMSIPYVPVEIPAMTEVEVPGSAYYVGPNGERITNLQRLQGNSTVAMPQGAEQVGGETIISEDPIFDGETVFPMGTFPSQEFGEKFISQTNVVEDGETIEVPGTFEGDADVAENNGMENEIPAGEVIQPDLDSEMATTEEVLPPAPDNADATAMSGTDIALGKSVIVDGDNQQQTNSDASEGNTAVDALNNLELKRLETQLDKLNTQHERLKERLSEANRSIEKLTAEKQKAERIVKEAAAGMGEMLAGIEHRLKAAKENSAKVAKAQASAQKKFDARENELKMELAETKQLLADATKKMEQSKPTDKLAADKLAALMTAKATADAGFAKLKKESEGETLKLKKQISGLKAQLKRAESKVNETKDKSAKVVKRLEKDLKSATQDAEKAEKALAEARKLAQKSTKEMSSELKASQTKLETLEKEMEEKIASAKEKAANLQSKLELATKEATAANKAAADAKAALAKLQSDSKTLAAKPQETIIRPGQPGGGEGLQGEVRIIVDPDTGQVTLIGDPDDTAIVRKSLEKLNSKNLQQEDSETDSEDSSDATGIAATPAPSPEPATGVTPKIEILPSDEKADSERDKRDAAMAEVNRKLAEREAERKKEQSAKEEKEAELKAAAEAKKSAEAKEAEMKAAAEAEAAKIKAAEEAKAQEADKLKSLKSELYLEDQIQILKDRRDKLIVKAELMIREKQEARIDKMIADGKAADSDEVVEALDELNDSINSSSEKLTARYRRKIENLKSSYKKKQESKEN